MSAEKSNSNVTDGWSSSPKESPTRSPKHKKRVIQLEQTIPVNYDASHSGDIRKLFLAPLLHYQAVMASGSHPTRLTINQVRELKKIACPASDLATPYKSKTDEVDDVTSKYNHLKNALQQFSTLPQSAENELISAIQQTYSHFIRASAEQAEKARETASLQAKHVDEEAEALADKQMLIDGKKQLLEILAIRKTQLSAMLHELREEAFEDENYQQLAMLTSRLEQKHRDIIRDIASDVPLDVTQLQQLVNRTIETQKNAFYAEIKAIEEIEKNSDHYALSELALYSLKYADKSTSVNREVTQPLIALTGRFIALKKDLAPKASRHKRLIEESAIRISELSYQLKRKYDHRKQDEDSSLDNLNRRFITAHGKKHFEKMTNIFSQATLPSAHVMQATAASLATEWYDYLPLINILPPVKKAYIARRNALYKFAVDIKRNRSLRDAYASITEAIPQTIDKNHHTVNFNKINTAISVIEANNRFVLVQDKAEIATLMSEVEQFQCQVKEGYAFDQVADILQPLLTTKIHQHAYENNKH
jgi:hypothetical protein